MIANSRSGNLSRSHKRQLADLHHQGSLYHSRTVVLPHHHRHRSCVTVLARSCINVLSGNHTVEHPRPISVCLNKKIDAEGGAQATWAFFAAGVEVAVCLCVSSAFSRARSFCLASYRSARAASLARAPASSTAGLDASSAAAAAAAVLASLTL